MIVTYVKCLAVNFVLPRAKLKCTLLNVSREDDAQTSQKRESHSPKWDRLPAAGLGVAKLTTTQSRDRGCVCRRQRKRVNSLRDRIHSI